MMQAVCLLHAPDQANWAMTTRHVNYNMFANFVALHSVE